MPLIGAKERVTTWKILFIKKESGISLCVVIADPLILANTHTNTHTQSGVSKLHPEFLWSLNPGHWRRRAQERPLSSRHFLSDIRTGLFPTGRCLCLFVCPSVCVCGRIGQCFVSDLPGRSDSGDHVAVYYSYTLRLCRYLLFPYCTHFNTKFKELWCHWEKFKDVWLKLDMKLSSQNLIPILSRNLCNIVLVNLKLVTNQHYVPLKSFWEHDCVTYNMLNFESFYSNVCLVFEITHNTALLPLKSFAHSK